VLPGVAIDNEIANDREMLIAAESSAGVRRIGVR